MTSRGLSHRKRAGGGRRLVAVVFAVVILLVVIAVVGPRLHGAFSLLDRGDQIDLGGREMFILCEGSGSPTIILEHGLGSSGIEWDDVQDRLADTNLVCFRSRAAMGFSDAAPDGGPRTAQDAVDDLANLLAASETPGPYVLVGHSFGGHVVRLYADQHPDQVVGMVLVDSMHERQLSSLREMISATSWSEVSGLFGSDNAERTDVQASAEQVDLTSPLGDVPLVVLEAAQQATDARAAGISEAAAIEIDAAMGDLWPRLQADLALLSSNSRHVRVTHSGHFIQADQPAAVVEAIRWVIGY